MSTKITHRTSGDPAVTIRHLVEVAERIGWSLDTPLSFLDEGDEKFYVRGVSLMSGGTFDLHPIHQDDWDVHVADEDPNDRIAARILKDMS